MNCRPHSSERLGTHHFENPTLPLAWNLGGWDGGRQSLPVRMHKGDCIPLVTVVSLGLLLFLKFKEQGFGGWRQSSVKGSGGREVALRKQKSAVLKYGLHTLQVFGNKLRKALSSLHSFPQLSKKSVSSGLGRAIKKLPLQPPHLNPSLFGEQ